MVLVFELGGRAFHIVVGAASRLISRERWSDEKVE